MKSKQAIYILFPITLAALLVGCTQGETEFEEVSKIPEKVRIVDFNTGQPIPNAEVRIADCDGTEDCVLISKAYYSDINGLVELPSMKFDQELEIRASGYHSYLQVGRYAWGHQRLRNDSSIMQYTMVPEASLRISIIGNPEEEEILDYAVIGCYFRESEIETGPDPRIPGLYQSAYCYGEYHGFGGAYLGNWQGLFYSGGWSSYPIFYDPQANLELTARAVGGAYFVLRVWLVVGPYYHSDNRDISKIVFMPRNEETEIVINLNDY